MWTIVAQRCILCRWMDTCQVALLLRQTPRQQLPPPLRQQQPQHQQQTHQQQKLQQQKHQQLHLLTPQSSRFHILQLLL